MNTLNMSVNTRAKELVAQAEEQMQGLISTVVELVTQNPWGWEDYRTEYKDRWREILAALIIAQGKMR